MTRIPRMPTKQMLFIRVIRGFSFLLRALRAFAVNTAWLAYKLKLSPQEQLALALGLVNLKPPPINSVEKSSTVPLR